VVDEAASQDVRVWNYVVRPTLAQTMGWGVFIGTPSGRNWFYDMFTRGVEGQEGFRSFRYSSLESPFFPKTEWEEARRQLPEDVFRQEYMAEFLEDSAGVFRGVDGCLMPEGAVARVPAGPPVVVGVDLAKHTDWTVCVAIEARTGRCFDMYRTNKLDWPFQRREIIEFARRHRAALVVLDATGVGDPIYDDVKRVLPNVEGFKITAQSKRELVQGLMVAVERGLLRWPAAWEVLTAEMKRYEYTITPNGGIGYSAPSGYHDDCVRALARAVGGAGRYAKGGGGGLMARLPRPSVSGRAKEPLVLV